MNALLAAIRRQRCRGQRLELLIAHSLILALAASNNKAWSIPAELFGII
jgi:hypothetical protein